MDSQETVTNYSTKAKEPKRHTHSTIAGLEDLTAVLVDLHFAIQRLQIFIAAAQTELNALQERVDVATDIANVVRIAPDAYPVDGKVRRDKTKARSKRIKQP